VRNVVHFTGQNLWFYAVTLIPLAQVFALEFTSPLWVLVFSPLLLGEQLTWNRVLAAGAGFLGILIVARPDTQTISPGVITAGISAIFFALTFIATKRLTATESIACILFWLTAIQLVLGAIAAGYDGQITLPTAETLPWLVVIAVCGLLAHFCITNALAVAPASVVVPLDFGRLPVVALIGWVLYDEALSLGVLAGAILIFSANYGNVLIESRRNRVA